MNAAGNYLVLASQRSGSTLLVESLRATGIAGQPAEFFQYLPATGRAPQPREWFATVADDSVTGLLAPLEPGTPSTESSADWRVRILRAGTSSNGVWGGKLMWNQVPLLLARAAGLPARSGTDLRSALHDVLGPQLLHIYVHREDVVAQAVSFWRAVQTQTWRGRAPADADARAQYHPHGIAHLVRILREQEQGWAQWFSSTGVDVVRVNYRELATDTTAVVASVLTRLGLDPAAAPPPALERQADSRSQEWVRRYQEAARKEGLPL